jgi:hypothetical protein
VLRDVIERLKAITGVEPAPEEDEEPAAAPAKGTVAVEALVGSREEAVAAHRERQRATIPPLEWKPGGRTADDVKARGAGGEYLVGRRNDGRFDTYVVKAGAKRPARLGAAPSETILAAKTLASNHHLEAATNALLRNAGAGELARADLAGEPVARKKGGRHG